MQGTQNRHDLKDNEWIKLEPIITKRLGKRGSNNAGDNRKFVNGVFWIL